MHLHVRCNNVAMDHLASCRVDGANERENAMQSQRLRITSTIVNICGMWNKIHSYRAGGALSSTVVTARRESLNGHDLWALE